MGVGRYELTEVQWRRIEPLLPGRAGTVGRPAEDNRRFVHGVLWVLRSGMRWHRRHRLRLTMASTIGRYVLGGIHI
jgi:transposase